VVPVSAVVIRGKRPSFAVRERADMAIEGHHLVAIKHQANRLIRSETKSVSNTTVCFTGKRPLVI